MINRNGLINLHEEIRSDPAFEHLRAGKQPLIPGEGDKPIAFIIGEAPGAVEVMKGRPFVGPAGEVMRELMDIAGLWATPQWSRGSDKFPETTGEILPNCWLTNVIKYRPPMNRTPTLPEIKASRKYIRREWELVGRPKMIIPVGAVALTCVMGKPMSILKHAGIAEFKTTRPTLKNPFPEAITVWPMIHPSYALRNKEMQPTLEQQWEKLGEWLVDRDYYSRYPSRR